ncbi:MAG: hypothetical protein KDI13_10295 [Alphaproteobacteria bacterium]|nr:hypothetical protein [Alphaproteobacteria bacterium]
MSPIQMQIEAEKKARMKNKYAQLVERLYDGDSSAMDLAASLRSYYPYTDGYSAFPDDLEDEIMALSFAAQDKDPEKARQALVEYRAFIKAHLGDVDVLYWAIPLAREDVRYGNPAFLKDIRDRLVNSIFEGHDGLTPDQAPSIVTFGEEALVLARAGGKVIGKPDLRKNGPQHVNVYDIQDDKTGRLFKFYINVTIPVEKSLQEYEAQQKDISKFQR